MFHDLPVVLGSIVTFLGGFFPAILELRQSNNSWTQVRRIADVVGHPTQVLDVSPRFATESDGESKTLFPHGRNSSWWKASCPTRTTYTERAQKS